jgi:hypothetical protein
MIYYLIYRRVMVEGSANDRMYLHKQTCPVCTPTHSTRAKMAEAQEARWAKAKAGK